LHTDGGPANQKKSAGGWEGAEKNPVGNKKMGRFIGGKRNNKNPESTKKGGANVGKDVG